MEIRIESKLGKSIVIILVMLACAALFIFGLKKFNDYREISSLCTASTTAKVVDCDRETTRVYRSTSKNSSTKTKVQYEIEYEYEVNDISYSKTIMSKTKRRVGHIVNTKYNPSNPSMCMLGESIFTGILIMVASCVFELLMLLGLVNTIKS